ncbi:MAG: nucleoside monophosphate kinase [Candidatus Pacebacteria bacterium]|nr:nucleoside monophosphate kinase [Candidatus Paceibacterota bacterium]
MKKQKLGFHIVLLGQIASGKDTQADLLKKDYVVQLVESGKYWRALAKKNTSDGDWVRRTTAKGKPAPVSLMKKFLVEQIEKKNKTKKLLFVGNPRLKPEGMLLNKLLKAKHEDYMVLYITLPDKEIKKRSYARVRNEDDRKYVDIRIAWHKDQVSKTVAYFNSLGRLVKINGNQTIEKVNKDIQKALQKHLEK